MHKHGVARRDCARFLLWQISYGDMDDPDALLLRILLVSDVHMAVERLAAVTDWARTAKPRWDAHVCLATAHRSSADRAWCVWWGRSFDLVLATGDMLDMGTKDQDDPISVSKAEGELGTLLARLETVVSRVLYIPGNVRGLRLPHLDRSCSAHRGAVAHSMIPSRRCI